MPTTYSSRTIPTTTYTGRPSIITSNTIAPIITGIWNDVATWTETGKFWNDAWDWVWTIYSWRLLI